MQNFHKTTARGIEGRRESSRSPPPQDHPGNLFFEDELEALRVIVSLLFYLHMLMWPQAVISPLVNDELSMYMTRYISDARQDMGSIELAFRSEIEHCNGVFSDHAQILKKCIDENVSLPYLFRFTSLKYS
jgi:hypothetical protein